MQSTDLILMPCAYFGCIEYFHYINSKKCVIEVNDYFVKQSLRTRCQIYGANGPLSLTVPKQRKNSSKTLFKNIRVNYDHNWQKEHWQSISSAYRSSPFFEFYEDEFQLLFHKKYTFLIDLNMEMIHFVCSRIGIEINFQISQNYLDNMISNDKRMDNFDNLSNPRYIQVFEKKFGFIPNLSILDLLFNEGNNAKTYLDTINS